MTRSRPRQCVGLALAILLAAASLTLAANPIDDPGIPQSCGMQLKNHNFTTRDLQQVRALGFGVVRKGMYWTAVETEKGKYDFSAYDQFVRDANDMGMLVIGTFFGNNDQYENDGPERGGIQTDAGRKGFANFAAAMVEHFKDANIIWEVWNEPNVRTFWRKDGMHNSEPFAEEYTLLVKEVMKAALAKNPDAFVVAGSVSNYWEPSYQWTESCFKNGILETGIKAWSVHPYGVKTPEEFVIGHDRTRALLKQYGAPDMVMIDTERGFAVENKRGTEEGWSGGSKEKALEFQAWHFVRQSMIDLLNDVRLTVWYEWDGGDSWTGSAFALTNQDGTPRPAGQAAETMFDQLNGYRLVRRIDTGFAQDYVIEFTNDAGDRKLVAWTSPEAGDEPELAIPHVIHVTGIDALTGVGIYGEPVAASIEGDSLDITVSGAPIYLSVASDAQLAFESVPPPKPEPVETPAELPDGSVSLKVFDDPSAWTFMKNTGEGAFQVFSHGDVGPVGTMTFDFTRSNASSTPYVLAEVNTDITEGATSLNMNVRAMIKQKLTFRLVDATGQTLQFKTTTTGVGGWETVAIPLNGRLEHWGGANDGTVHFPVKKLVFCVPQPDAEHLTGAVEYNGVSVKR